MLSPFSSTLPTFTVGTKVGLSKSTSCRFVFCAEADRQERGKARSTVSTLAPQVLYVQLSIINCQLSLIRFSPVMSAGCSNPMMCRILGATSARRPSFTVAELLLVT